MPPKTPLILIIGRFSEKLRRKWKRRDVPSDALERVSFANFLERRQLPSDRADAIGIEADKNQRVTLRGSLGEDLAPGPNGEASSEKADAIRISAALIHRHDAALIFDRADAREPG